MTIAIMLLVMFALALLNVPIAVALGIVGIGAVLIVQGGDMLPKPRPKDDARSVCRPLQSEISRR